MYSRSFSLFQRVTTSALFWMQSAGLSGLFFGSMFIQEASLASPCCCAGNCCPANCPDVTVVAAIVAQATVITAQNIMGSSPSVFLQTDQALFIVTDSNNNKYYCPIKRYGCSPLCFYRIPLPGQTLGGWVPVVFSSTDELFQAWFTCNVLPELSCYDKRVIASLYLPGVCSR